MILHDFYMQSDVFSNQIVLVGYTVTLGERISLHCVEVKILLLKKNLFFKCWLTETRFPGLHLCTHLKIPGVCQKTKKKNVRPLPLYFSEYSPVNNLKETCFQ